MDYAAEMFRAYSLFQLKLPASKVSAEYQFIQAEILLQAQPYY